MNNKTRQRILIIAIIGALVYVLIGIPGLIVNETFVGEEGIGHMRGVSLSVDWLFAVALLLSLLILYRFRKA